MFNKTLIEGLPVTHISRIGNIIQVGSSWAECIRVPWQFLDAMIPDDGQAVDASHPTKLWGTHLASSLCLNSTNNVREPRDVLHEMVNEFEFGSPTAWALAQPSNLAQHAGL